MKYIIVDLEATCWEEKKGRTNEIIEIGAVCIDENQQILDEFMMIVKPVVHPTLSDFCVQLTSITQEMVDNGTYFYLALTQFLDWIQKFDNEYFICSWGYYDRVQFQNDCALHQLDASWVENHISLKHQYAKIKHLRRPIGMKNALKQEKIPLDGTHHRGIDDARNISKIFLKYFEQWNFLPKN